MKSSTQSRKLPPRPGPARNRVAGNPVACLAAVLCLGATAVPAAAGDFAVPLAAAPPAQDDEWQFGFGVYALMPEISTTASNGYNVDISFDEILSSLDMTMMTWFGARKGRWSFGSDLIYLAMGSDRYGSPGRLSTRLDVQLKSWIINPVVGYTVLQGDWGHLDVMAGARYLYLKQQTGLSVGTVLGNVYGYTTSSGDSWAGIVGVRGRISLSEHWFMPYYLDVGTGDPDLTWQAYVGIGYHFRNFDLTLGYRYLDWDLGSGGAVTSMDVKGPQLGVAFEF